MRKIFFILFAATILYSSCSKDHFVNPSKKNLFKVSILPPVDAIPNSTWQQVLGGEAIVQYAVQNSDTLSASSVEDSLNLKNIGTYSKQLIPGTYDITLATKSTAVVDTFIRFNAGVKSIAVNKDQAISLTAVTTDGVITISKDQIDPTIVPTFTPSGSATSYNFGLANGYYFIYVKGAVSGRITFTEATTGDLYLKDITVTAMNQYDISAILNTVSVHSRPFYLKNNL